MNEVVSVQRSDGVGIQVQDQIIPRTSLADEVGIVERSARFGVQVQDQIFRGLRWRTKLTAFNAVIQAASTSKS